MGQEYSLKELVAAYNKGLNKPQLWGGIPISRPTKRSILQINERFGFELPESFIYFSKHCLRNDWLVSIGEDYDSPFHIFRVNKICHTIRRRVIKGKGKWENVCPPHFVAYTLGHDDDYQCFDLSKKNDFSGEYATQYWAPPRIFGSKSNDFPSDMTSALKSWGLL